MWNSLRVLVEVVGATKYWEIFQITVEQALPDICRNILVGVASGGMFERSGIESVSWRQLLPIELVSWVCLRNLHHDLCCGGGLARLDLLLKSFTSKGSS